MSRRKNAPANETDTASQSTGTETTPETNDTGAATADSQTDASSATPPADPAAPGTGDTPYEGGNNDNPEKDTPPEDPVETVAALALVDNHTHGLRCGFVCELPGDVAEQLEKDGVIDRNEKAIARGRRPEKAEQ